MARRSRRELGTFEILTIHPWWVGVIVAIVAYQGLAVYLPSKWAGNPVLSPSIPLVVMFGKVLAGLALLAAAISAIKRMFAARSTVGYSPHGSGAHIIPPSRTVPPPEIQVECPNCRNELVAPGELAGKQVRCEACRAEFEVPRPVIKFPDARSRL